MERSTFVAKEETSIICELGNVTLNGNEEKAVSPFAIFVTLTGWYEALIGTVTVSCVTAAAVTFALTAPNQTILLDAVRL